MFWEGRMRAMFQVTRPSSTVLHPDLILALHAVSTIIPGMKIKSSRKKESGSRNEVAGVVTASQRSQETGTESSMRSIFPADSIDPSCPSDVG
jgi:hypothetical protein